MLYRFVHATPTPRRPCGIAFRPDIAPCRPPGANEWNMGIRLEIFCEQCGWSGQYRLGIGSNTPQLRDALHLLDQSSRPVVETLLQKHPDHTEDFEFRLMHCPDCGQLLERLYVSLFYGAREHWETRHHCPDCGTALVPVPDPMSTSTLPCPDCGQFVLHPGDATFWD